MYRFDIKYICRRDGYEKQYRYHCPRCELPVAYEMNEQRKSGAYTYILVFEISSPPPTAKGVGNLANIGFTGLAGGEGVALAGCFSSSGA